MSDTLSAITDTVWSPVLDRTEVTIDTQDHGTFTAAVVHHGSVSSTFIKGEYGQQRTVNIHDIVSMNVKNGAFGPAYVFQHGDGTTTTVYTYPA